MSNINGVGPSYSAPVAGHEANTARKAAADHAPATGNESTVKSFINSLAEAHRAVNNRRSGHSTGITA